MYSPLLQFTLNLNQKITDKVYRYRSAIYWDQTQGKFSLENIKFPNLLPWKLINYGIIVCIGMPSCLFVLLNTLHTPGIYHLFQVYAVSLLMMFAIIISGSCWTLSTYCTEIVFCLNGIKNLQSFIVSAPSLSIVHQESKTKPKSTKLKQCVISKAKTIFYVNGKFDYVGMIAIGIVVSFACIPFFVPFAWVYLGIDSPRFVFDAYFPVNNRNTKTWLGILIIRLIIAFCCAVEGCTTFRTLALYAILWFQDFENCVNLLASMLPNFSKWSALKSVFVTGNDALSSFISLYLGVVFLLEIVFITVSLVDMDNMPWFVYFNFPLFTGLSLIIISEIFSQAVRIHSGSSRLKQIWGWKSAKCMFVHGRENGFAKRLLQRSLKCIHPIAFNYGSYGSMGTVTKRTRTDYYYSMLTYTASAIIASRQ